MQIKVQIRGDVPNSFPKKNGERVNERILTLLDLSEGHVPMAETIEAVDPAQNFNGLSMAGKIGTFTVREMIARQSGVRLVGTFELAAAK